MSQPTVTVLHPEREAGREKWLPTLIGTSTMLLLLLYWWSGLSRLMTTENLPGLRANVRAAGFIISAIIVHWFHQHHLHSETYSVRGDK